MKTLLKYLRFEFWDAPESILSLALQDDLWEALDKYIRASMEEQCAFKRAQALMGVDYHEGGSLGVSIN
jgi:hypothetical protein